MSGYPTMDQYNDVVQHPHTAFADPVLKVAKIASNGMGIPIALGGGFALTYTATTQSGKFAIRCFLKEVKGLEARYIQIDKGLRAAGGSYFVGFEYQPLGVMVDGRRFPIVKMLWVEGDTLGSFLEDNYSDKTKIEKLRTQFIELERFLRSKNIAHGDLQNGNIILKEGDLKLIDYDGVCVPTLAAEHGTELGHRHFQHPKRSASDFGVEMDRFSFIVIDLSLRALAHNPQLFMKYSNGENILLNASDFNNPANSAAFSDLRSIPTLLRDVENLAKICAAPITNVPTLADFLAGKNIPRISIVISAVKAGKQEVVYVSAYDVIDARKYSIVEKQIGNRVELIGVVTKVHTAKTKYGKPYCFVFFDNSRQSVKLNIWSEGLAKLASAPTQAWVGIWLSVQGLVDPPYTGRYGTSLSITITSSSQFRTITEAEATHRLKSPLRTQPVGNRAVLDRLKTKKGTGSKHPAHAPPVMHGNSPQTKNKAILDTISQNQRTTSPHSLQGSRPSPSPKREIPWGWLIFGVFVLLLILQAL
jgi:hypothetical protein